MNCEAEKQGANGFPLLYRGYSIDSVCWPQKSVDGSPQTEWAKGVSSGMRILMAFSILSRRMVLKAFLKSNLRMTSLGWRLSRKSQVA